ncbi:MAG: N-acetylglucosamine-6-phosphate deacetylase [Bacillota bacterium]|nr:N-acetylglucosamine-6-phosphate deacetylase [Bacillota bacterium]
MAVGGREEGRARPAGRLTALVAERLYAPEAVAGPVAVLVRDGRVVDVWRETGSRQAAERLAGAGEVADLGGARLAPGFIDLHTHAFRGHDVTSGGAEEVAAMARELPRTGVTAFYPTVASAPPEATERQVRRIAQVAGDGPPPPAAEVLGIRLEGPYISKAKKGAQYEPAIRPPDAGELARLAEAAQGWLRFLDFAPEEDGDGSFLAAVVERGLIACVGHTMATYEQALRAIDGGARHCTHLFDAMPPLAHRAPGAPGAFLSDRRATVEVIADGIHLHPAVLRLVLAARGADEVALVTDAVAAAGLGDGEYEFAGRRVLVRDGAVRLPDGTLAGSTLTMDRAVRNMVALAGASWEEAIRMATWTPARIAGVAERKGRVAAGMDADLVALDAEGRVVATWTRGELAFEMPGVALHA